MLTAIVGILLGNLLIANLFAPALQRLREILGRFASIELPYESYWPEEDISTLEQRRRMEETAVNEFNKLFREYEISFKAFKKIGFVFVFAIVLLACAVVWQTPLGRGARVLIMPVSVAVILVVGWFLQRAIAPTAAQLVSIDFLENNFANLHLESFFNCARLHVSFGRGLASRDPVMHFSISQKLMFLGYKFLLLVTDDQCSRIYFVSYGHLGSSSSFRQYWTPEIKAFEVPLGDFSFTDAMRSSNLLHLHLWLFVPTPRGWVKPRADRPRFLSEPITEEFGKDVGVRLASGNCSWGSVDERVTFDRKFILGLPFWKLGLLDDSHLEPPQTALKLFKGNMERCRGLVSEDLPSGRTIDGKLN